MKAKNIFLLGLGLIWSVSGFSQATTGAQELNTIPPAQTELIKPTQPEVSVTPAAGFYTPGKIQYNFSVGSQFSRFGSATYIQPSISYPLTKRFSTFASVSFVQTYGSMFGRYPLESELPGASFNQRQLHSVVQLGGNYVVNEKLNITGSVWRDFSKQSAIYNMPINVFSPGGTKGMQFRANYKLTDNLSVSGGFRYSNGANYYNPFYQGFTPGAF